MVRARLRLLSLLVGLAAGGCATAGGGVGSPTEATTLVGLAQTAYYRGDYPTASAHFARARQLYERYDDQEGVAYTWNNLGSVALRTRDYARAERNFRRARDIFTSLDDLNGAAIATNNRGSALRYLGRLEEASLAHKAALVAAEAAGNVIVQAAAHGGVGLVLLDAPDVTARDLDEAERRFRQARSLQRKEKDELGEAATLGNLGAVAAMRNDLPEAIARYEAALKLDQELEHVGGIAQDLISLAELHVRAEDYAAARTFAERARRVHEEIQDEVGARRSREIIQEIEARQGTGLADAEGRRPAT